MLHIFNKSPLTNSSLTDCLRVASGGEILLTEDAVYAATNGNAYAGKLNEVMGRFKIYVLQPDLDARGVGDRVVSGVTAVDYAGFVDLVANNKACQSWL